MRKKVEVAERVALRAALQLGITTYAANNGEELETKEDGSLVARAVRDSDGLPRSSPHRKTAREGVKPEKNGKKTVKGSTLVKPTKSGLPRGRTRPLKPTSGKKLAALLAKQPKRTPPTLEFLRTEAAKLANSAVEVCNDEGNNEPAETVQPEEFKSFFLLQADQLPEEGEVRNEELELQPGQLEACLTEILEEQERASLAAEQKKLKRAKEEAVETERKRRRLFNYARPTQEPRSKGAQTNVSRDILTLLRDKG